MGTAKTQKGRMDFRQIITIYRNVKYAFNAKYHRQHSNHQSALPKKRIHFTKPQSQHSNHKEKLNYNP